MKDFYTNERAVRELCEIRKLLEEHFRKEKPLEIGTPNLVDITFVLRKLEISRSTFYKHVKGKLLKPVLRIGTRDYYECDDVQNLHIIQAESRLPYRLIILDKVDSKTTKRAA